MKKIMSLVATAMLLASPVAANAAQQAGAVNAPGNPDINKQQTFVMNWCKGNPRDPSCNDFNQHHSKWSNSQYHDWYQSHHSMHGFDPAAAAIFGFTAAAVGAAVANSMAPSPHMNHHQRLCFAKYGDHYNPVNDMVKFPGHRPHPCDI